MGGNRRPCGPCRPALMRCARRRSASSRLKRIGDREEPLTNDVQMVEPFFGAEVGQVIGTEFIAQEAGELLILFQTGVFPVRSENVMTMFDLVEHIGGFSI